MAKVVLIAGMREVLTILNAMLGDQVHGVEIDTQRTQQGATLKASQTVERRERLTRRKRWEIQDEGETYTAKQLDRDVVNPDQIRTVIKAYRDHLPQIFPGRHEVPKTLTFAKTDSHADDITRSSANRSSSPTN